MNLAWRISLLAGCLVASDAAWATPKDYCLAYARDFADVGPRDEKTWTARHDNALADCLFQYQSAKSDPPKTPPRKVVKQAVKNEAKPKPVLEALPEVTEELPEPAVIVAPDIAPPAKQVKPATKAGAPAKKTLFAKFFTRKEANAPLPVPVETGRPAPGSAAWLDYCEKKYASFDRASGTYTSFKGIERKCLVTE